MAMGDQASIRSEVEVVGDQNGESKDRIERKTVLLEAEQELPIHRAVNARDLGEITTAVNAGHSINEQEQVSVVILRAEG